MFLPKNRIIPNQHEIVYFSHQYGLVSFVRKSKNGQTPLTLVNWGKLGINLSLSLLTSSQTSESVQIFDFLGRVSFIKLSVVCYNSNSSFSNFLCNTKNLITILKSNILETSKLQMLFKSEFNLFWVKLLKTCFLLILYLYKTCLSVF